LIESGRNGAALSAVIPCWNDHEALEARLTEIAKLRGVTEVIVADASPGGTETCAAKFAGVRFVPCEKPNRGAQLNAGAAVARGCVLLFHHADSLLTQAHIDSLAATLRDEKIVGGGFHRKFDDRHPHLRWLEPLVRRLSRYGGTVYGDQSLFVRRAAFEQMGGFAAIPLMEDIEFSRRLKRTGRTVVIDPPMESSKRRHARHGAWRTTIENGCLILLFRLGFPAGLLHRWYYRTKISQG
jgi:rSAM/selenodomain-associated transferase 2